MPGHPAIHKRIQERAKGDKSLACSMGGNKYHKLCDFRPGRCACNCHKKEGIQK